MLTDFPVLLAGLALLTLGAEVLIRGSASLALRLGLTPLVIGLTVVAFGTSMPELVVSLGATLNNQGDIALGNIVGSNIFNIGVILGIAALICPIKVNLAVIRTDAPVMLVVSGLLLWLASLGTFTRPAGFALLTGLICYTVFNVKMAAKETTSSFAQDFEKGMPAQTGSSLRDLSMIFGGLVLLVGGSRLFVIGATAIAQGFGVSEAVIGLTVVAAGTSMPELATSVLAAIRRQPDIAIGNVVGSNIFNILGILGTTSLVRPLTAPGVSSLDLWVMFAFAVALLPLLWTGYRLQRWEGLMLLGGYGLYLRMLWPT